MKIIHIDPKLLIRGITHHAGLNEDQSEHLKQGISEGSEPLLLERDPYTKLQRYFEELMLKVLDPLQHPYGYLTPRPLTPLYKEDHPRYNIVREVFIPHEPFGISVINKQVLEEIVKTGVLDIDAREKIAEVMSGVHANVFSMHDESEKGGTYLALEEGDFTPPLAFEAVQMTSPENNKQGGRIIFGEEAQDMYSRVIGLHEQNLEQGRGRNAILEILSV